MTYPIGHWQRPICPWCLTAIEPSADPRRPVQRVERGVWSCWDCWSRHQAAYKQIGPASFYQQAMELRSVA